MNFGFFFFTFLQTTGLTSNIFLADLNDLNFFSFRLSDYYWTHSSCCFTAQKKNLWQTPIIKGINSKIFELYVTMHHNIDPLCLNILIFHILKTIFSFLVSVPSTAVLICLFWSLVLWFTTFNLFTILISLHLLTIQTFNSFTI